MMVLQQKGPMRRRIAGTRNGEEKRKNGEGKRERKVPRMMRTVVQHQATRTQTLSQTGAETETETLMPTRTPMLMSNCPQ